MSDLTTQEWLELVADFESQPGQSMTAFAHAHGVDTKVLRSWVKRVRTEGAEAEVEGPERLDDILVAAARLHGGLSITQVSNAAGVSRTVARKWLSWLVEEDRLKKVGNSASQRFVIP